MSSSSSSHHVFTPRSLSSMTTQPTPNSKMSHQPDFDDTVSSISDDDAPEIPDLVSDGKRMRQVWKPGDGNGDPSPQVIERSMYLVRGHPTWKIFIGDIPSPIVRGSDEEPPHYVYLDDQACYAIFCSGAYSKAELRDFYPWDFNHQGHIKQGRLNRGNPAYLDDSNTEFAKGQLRGKGQWYTFSGAPEETDYEPSRSKRKKGAMEDDDASGDELRSSTPKSLPTTATTQVTVTTSTLQGSSKNTPNQASQSLRTPSKRPLTSDGSGGAEQAEGSPMKRRIVTPSENKPPTKSVRMPSSHKPRSNPAFGGDGAQDDDEQKDVTMTDVSTSETPNSDNQPSCLQEEKKKQTDLLRSRLAYFKSVMNASGTESQKKKQENSETKHDSSSAQ